MRTPVGLLAASAMAATGLLFSACGGASTPGVASLGATTTTAAAAHGTSGRTKRGAAITFAKCMRSHGVKNFPEKSGTTGNVQIGGDSGIDPNSSTFKAAEQACQSLLPRPSPAQIEKAEHNALEFSKCMRAHGVANFPDPKFSANGGGISLRIGGPGLDPNSPAFQRAQQACGKYMHLPKGAKGARGSASRQFAPAS